MNAIIDMSSLDVAPLAGEPRRAARSRPNLARRAARTIEKGTTASDASTTHPILTRIRSTPILDQERQHLALRRHRNACLDIDWILAMSPVTAAHVRSVLALFEDEDFRLSDYFHMDKKPGRDKREGTASRRREALKAKYLALCEAYIDAHEAHLEVDQEAMRPESVQRLADAFRAVGLHGNSRATITAEILEAGAAPTACRKARSLAIMLRQATTETEAARSIIETSNQRLVLSIARKLRALAPDMDISDLLAEGQFGLRRAIEKFEPDLGNKFTTYAVWWIRQSILRAIKDRSSLIRIPSHVQEKTRKSSDAGDWTRRPLTEIVSLHEPLAGTSDRTLSDVLADDEETGSEQTLLQKQTREVLAKAITRLSDRERFVILHRFGLRSREMDIGAIAARLDLSKERIRQIERDALRKLAACRGVAELRP